ncbi:RidA family protein [Sinomonas soli]
MGIERIPGGSGLPFSKAVSVQGPGRWIFVAGQLGLDENGALVPGGIAAEAAQAFARVLGAVHEAGGDTGHVVKITAALTSLDEVGSYLNAIRQAFGEHLPASTTVQAAGLLLGAHVEIDAVAFVPDPSPHS